jgi:signal transduction histidine kinase
MRERAAAFGGEVMLHGEAGRGTVVRVEVPLTPGDHGGERA